MCDRKDCARPGIWRVGFTFAALGHPGSKRGRAESGLVVCTEHKADTTIENAFGRAEILEVIRGVCRAGRLAEPDPDSLELTFEAVN